MNELRIGAWRLCEGCATGQHTKHQTPCDCEIEESK